MRLPASAEDTSLPPDINVFVMSRGRLPRIGDDIPPWHFRGWLLYQLQIADCHPQLPGRWGHYLRTLEAGRLLGEPIPQIRFADSQDPKGIKMLERCLQLIGQRESSWSAFQRFTEWLAWGLAVSGEMPPLEEPTQEALYRTFNLEPLLLHPHDYLGSMLADRRSGGWNPNSFYPTPHNVVEMMVQMTCGRDPGEARVCDIRVKTILDPAVGTGRMLLHASNISYCLYGCDIDPLVVMICRINGALYAPWMAFPFPQKWLGVELPPPPPAPLPVPEEHQPGEEQTAFRSDDRGQGLLFP